MSSLGKNHFCKYYQTWQFCFSSSFLVECFCRVTNHKEFWPKEAAKQNPQFRIYLGTQASNLLLREIHSYIWKTQENTVDRLQESSTSNFGFIWELRQARWSVNDSFAICLVTLLVCFCCDLSGKASKLVEAKQFGVGIDKFHGTHSPTNVARHSAAFVSLHCKQQSKLFELHAHIAHSQMLPKKSQNSALSDFVSAALKYVEKQ